jgi:hypothetical protein
VPPLPPPPLPPPPSPPTSPRRLRQTPWRLQHQQRQQEQQLQQHQSRHQHGQSQAQNQQPPDQQQQLPDQQQPNQHHQQSQQQKRRLAFASVPYIPCLSKQLQRVFQKNDCQVFFRSGTSLKNLLCGANKTQPPKLERKGIYKLSCNCSPTASYVGETRVSFRTRVKQHKDGVANFNPETSNLANVSGITRHAAQCPNGKINWEDPEILATFQNKKKTKLQKDLFVRESLEIRHQKTGPARGLNDDFGKCVKTNAWGPLLEKIKR